MSTEAGTVTLRSSSMPPSVDRLTGTVAAWGALAETSDLLSWFLADEWE